MFRAQLVATVQDVILISTFNLLLLAGWTKGFDPKMPRLSIASMSLLASLAYKQNQGEGGRRIEKLTDKTLVIKGVFVSSCQNPSVL